MLEQTVQLIAIFRTAPVLKGVMLLQPIAEFVVTETDRLKSVDHGARPFKVPIRASHITYRVVCQGALEGGSAPHRGDGSGNKVLMERVPIPAHSPRSARPRFGAVRAVPRTCGPLLGRPRLTSPVCNMWPDFCSCVVFEIFLLHFAWEGVQGLHLISRAAGCLGSSGGRYSSRVLSYCSQIVFLGTKEKYTKWVLARY